MASDVAAGRGAGRGGILRGIFGMMGEWVVLADSVVDVRSIGVSCSSSISLLPTATEDGIFGFVLGSVDLSRSTFSLRMSISCKASLIFFSEPKTL